MKFGRLLGAVAKTLALGCAGACAGTHAPQDAHTGAIDDGASPEGSEAQAVGGPVGDAHVPGGGPSDASRPEDAANVGGDTGVADAAPGDTGLADAALGDAGIAGLGTVSCDRRPLACRIAEPVCAAGEVVSIVGRCFGPCVPLEQCACTEASACPFPEMYTCFMSAKHCGPYVH